MLGKSLVRLTIAALAASAFAVIPATSAFATAPSTTLLFDGDADGNGYMLGSFNYTISADNQRILATTGERLDFANDVDLSTDLYLLDRGTGSATLTSVDSTGQNLGGDDTGATADGMTDDGAYVVFASNGNYLGDQSSCCYFHDVYLRNTSSGVIQRISPGGAGEVNDNPRITPDGHYIVYTHGFYGSNDASIVRHDVANGAEITIADHGFNPSISDDGSRISYWTSTDNVPYSGEHHAFVATITGGIVDTTQIDGSGTADSELPVLSPDGNFVAFESRDTSLSPDLAGTDPYFGPWIFVRNLSTDALELASRRSDGVPASAFLGGVGQQFSSNDRYLTFVTGAQLSYQDTNIAPDVFLHDRLTGRTTRVSLYPNGSEFGQVLPPGSPVVSPDGTTVVFTGYGGAYVRDNANASNNTPTAAISSYPISGLTVQLSASASSDPDTTIDYDHIVRYDFDLDGNGTIDQSSSSSSAYYTFAAAGTYHPTVTVYDSYGANDTATTAVSVSTVYGNAVLADSPQSWYRLDETSGTAANDSAGTHNGSYFGAVTRGVTGATSSDGDAAAQFDGSRAAVDLPAPAANENSDFSIEAWVKTTVTDKSAYLVTTSKGSALRASLATDTKTGTKLRFVLHDDATKSLTITGTATINDGSYHYVVAERSGNTLSLYVDNALVATKALPAGFGTVTIDKASIGAKRIAGKAKFSTGFKGPIDEVAFYGSALDSSQRSSHLSAAGGGGGGGGES